jgi:3-hydroxyisobutyrate dehydrogenase
MTIAYFGTGLLGSGFVRRQLELGTAVHVWNRSPAKARTLVADGAVFFDDPAAAVAGVERLHLTLADDASVDAVLEPLAGVLASATVVVDHTTLAPGLTAQRIARWDGRGIAYVHAPVFMQPQAAREASGVMLTSTTQARYDALRPALERMTGKLVYLGDDAPRAAAFKLFGNLMVLATSTAISDINRLAGAVGIPTADAMDVFSFFNPGAMIPVRAGRVANGDFAPTFELAMARKDARLMIDEAQQHGVRLGLVPAIAAVFDEAIARGYGAEDSGATARLDGRS